MKRLFRWTTLLTVAIAATLVCACSDDENDQRKLTLADLEGDYAGTFDFTPAPSDLNENPAPENGVAVALRVTDGKVCFPEFPAATLVKALVGEEGAAALVPMLGTISYEAPIGTPVASAKRLSAELAVPTLRLDVGGALIVLISIASPDALVYTDDGELTFTLETTKCQLGEGESAGEPFDLINELKFRVAKK